jgi:hypothetical protein
MKHQDKFNITFTLQLHYSTLQYITFTLHLHYIYITFTLQLHFNYIAITLHLHDNHITTLKLHSIALQLHFFLETKGKVSLPVSLDPNTFSSSNKGVSCRK